MGTAPVRRHGPRLHHRRASGRGRDRGRPRLRLPFMTGSVAVTSEVDLLVAGQKGLLVVQGDDRQVRRPRLPAAGNGRRLSDGCPCPASRYLAGTLTWVAHWGIGEVRRYYLDGQIVDRVVATAPTPPQSLSPDPVCAPSSSLRPAWRSSRGCSPHTPTPAGSWSPCATYSTVRPPLLGRRGAVPDAVPRHPSTPAPARSRHLRKAGQQCSS